MKKEKKTFGLILKNKDSREDIEYCLKSLIIKFKLQRLTNLLYFFFILQKTKWFLGAITIAAIGYQLSQIKPS